MINGLRAFLQAAAYDRIMAKAERHCLSEWRAELLESLAGEVLEIGSGTGVNLQYYSGRVRRLMLSEPDPHMRRKLEQRVAAVCAPHIEIFPCSAEQINLPEASLDHVVSTLVLCSVNDVDQTLQQIRRLLRPGGSLVLLEHVGADDPDLFHLQRRLEPFWKWCAGNCHLTRKTAQLLEQAGFEPKLEQEQMRGVPRFVRPVIRGMALRR